MALVSRRGEDVNNTLRAGFTTCEDCVGCEDVCTHTIK